MPPHSEKRMDIQQASHTIQWLDEERRKDKKEMAALLERLNAQQQQWLAAVKRLEALEAAAKRQESRLRDEADERQSKALSELHGQIAKVLEHDEVWSRAMAAMEEHRRHSGKRLNEFQVELADLRRCMEELRAKGDVLEDVIRRGDTKLSELAALEGERRKQLMAWQEQQAMWMAEHERALNEWGARLEALQVLAEETRTGNAVIAEVQRDARRLLDEVQGVSDRLETRLHEMTEIRRMGEERQRQDWASFLADDQKRSTAQNLRRDEQVREHERWGQGVTDRLTVLEEQIAKALGSLRTREASDAGRLEAMLGLLQEWAAEREA